MKFSQKDFLTFKREADKCLKKLGLQDWHVVYSFEAMEHTLATCDVNFEARGATVSLRRNELKEWDQKIDVRVVARHEILELLLRRLQNMAVQAVCADVVYEEKHSIIRRLEKLL